MARTNIGLLLAVLVIVRAISFRSRAQELPTVKVEVNVVNVLATVRDQNGRILNNLHYDSDTYPGQFGIICSVRLFAHVG